MQTSRMRCVDEDRVRDGIDVVFERSLFTFVKPERNKVPESFRCT